jgi:hypothetical protein
MKPSFSFQQSDCHTGLLMVITIPTGSERKHVETRKNISSKAQKVTAHSHSHPSNPLDNFVKPLTLRIITMLEQQRKLLLTPPLPTFQQPLG